MSPVKIEELEGGVVFNDDYFFVKIGEPVPLKANDSNFDVETLPSQPIALSERFGLTFVAHSSGFFVARTKDLIDSAKVFKDNGSGSPVEQLSLVDVPIGRVRILALSTDNSTLAASVAGDIRFYSVDSFLNKEVKQSFSCSLNDATFVKDMRWITTSENSYVVLSNTGELYHGETGSPLKHMMDSVEAVDWGVKGTFVAMARKSVLSILSAKFEERFSISLPFRSWIGDTTNVSVKVDSVKCVRPDSIIIGCFQLTEDGKEENYLIQVISSRLGEISDGCSELVVQSFYDIYQVLNDDIAPPGDGPYLLLAYLEQCQLVINANMKNSDDHIVLLGWSQDDDKNEAAVVNTEREKWVPRIELQENGDDNFLLGLCIDNVSICQKVELQLGEGEMTELSPICVLICLTLEGKLVLFHIASLAGSKVSPEVDSALHHEECASVKLPVGESSTFSHGLQKNEQDLDQTVDVSENLKSKPFVNPCQITRTEDYTKYPEAESATNVQSSKSDVLQIVPDVDVKQNDSQIICPPGEQQKNLGASIKLPVGESSTFSHGLQKNEQDLDQTVDVSENLKSKPFVNPCQITRTEDYTKYPEAESATNVQSSKSDVLQMVPDVDVKQNDSQIICPPGEQQKNLGQKTAALGTTSIGSFTANRNSAALGLTSYKYFQDMTEMSTELQNTNNSQDSQRASHLLPDETFSFPKNSVVSSFSASSYVDGSGYQNKKYTIGATNVHAANVPGSIGGKPFLVKDVNVESPAIYSASRSVQSGGQLTSIGAESSHLSLNGNTATGKSSIRKFHPSNEQHGNSSKLAISSSDFSKQFGNINEMTKELDLLLKSIEEAGGFRDACTRSLRSSIEAVEQSMDTLSKQCKIWTCQVDQHREEVHFLLNKTIQVLARKVYMEGIYKQASDSRYMDLWNRQKLNSELELKRQHILSLNQDLTYQLVELERHFNALELNKFSQYGGHHIGHGASQSRYGPSRNIQSLHSLQNAISSQLVAAENLSECLSKQMEALSLRSPSEEQKNVKELFETIGIPYDASFGSPDMKGFMKTPSKKLLFSDLTTNKDKSKRVQASAMKSCEPEMSRRRRDSLDQSWTCSEPPKTIIKRMLLQELQKPNWKESSFSKEKVKISMPEESITHQMDARIPSVVFPASEMTASFLGSHLALEPVSVHSKAFIQDGNLQTPPQVSDSKSRVLQRSNISASPPRPAFHLSPAMLHGHSTETKDLAAEKSNVVQKYDSVSNSENKSLFTNMPQKSSSSTCSTTETPLLLIKSSEMPITNSKMTMATSFMMGDKLSGAFTPESWGKNFPSSESHSSTISAVSQSERPSDTPLQLSTSFLASASVSSGKNFPSSESHTSTISAVSQSERPSDTPLQLSTSFLASASVSSGKNGGLDVGISQEDEMEEEAPEASNATELGLGSLGGFGIGSTPNPSMPKSNPFGGSFNNVATSLPSSSITFAVPSGELFRPASFTFSSPQSSAPTQSTNSGACSGGFSVGAAVPAQAPTAFGQPAQIGSGQQVLGSVLGTFGQSRQLGGGLPGSGFAAPTGFGGGFAGSTSTSGFSNAALSGGFAGIASTGGGFAGISSTGSGFSGHASPVGGFAGAASTGGSFASAPSGGGFTGIASTGGGFAGITSTGSGFSGHASPVGGFAGAASTGGSFAAAPSGGFARAAPTGGGFAAAASTGGFAGAGSVGGFGAFSSQGSGGFSAFSQVGGNKPPELFTQMRK